MATNNYERIIRPRPFPCDRCEAEITDGVLVALGGVWCDGCAENHAEPNTGLPAPSTAPVDVLYDDLEAWLIGERIYAEGTGDKARGELFRAVSKKLLDVYLVATKEIE